MTSMGKEIWYRIEILARCRDKITLHLKHPYPDNNGWNKEVIS